VEGLTPFLLVDFSTSTETQHLANVLIKNDIGMRLFGGV
jgi:hypothetical protein